MKIAPIIRAMKCENILVHTGQHYDNNMSDSFFKDLGIPHPDINLEVGSGSHAEQTAKIMIEFEKVCLKEKPTHVLVVGDVNSTIACALVAKKLGIKIIHVEAGLRSFDETMPEEINRVLVDRISDYLFVTEQSGVDNLLKEGVAKEKIHLVGNVMIDTLIYNLPKIDKIKKYSEEDYCVVTMHRPSNVDNKEILERLLKVIKEIPIKVVFPMHPRTRGKVKSLDGVDVLEPLGYLDFMNLVKNAKFMLTDSGGIQEETTYLGVPCITMRENTERPVTVEVGSNVLVGSDVALIKKNIELVLKGGFKKGSVPEMWDGETAERVFDKL
ncbi:MAG: UDP-N-acetylglucosamine 2-epimerase (non-hydrolyzing) [Nanoarchaeota archaeon]|nr:UDP-N-acetylglucosamine 2-epimerase (non-hydrolyzing) [Nanoarchaeota archaeon]